MDDVTWVEGWLWNVSERMWNAGEMIMWHEWTDVTWHVWTNVTCKWMDDVTWMDMWHVSGEMTWRVNGHQCVWPVTVYVRTRGRSEGPFTSIMDHMCERSTAPPVVNNLPHHATPSHSAHYHIWSALQPLKCGCGRASSGQSEMW